MNFFEQQDIARRNARLLLVLFLLSVVMLIIVTNALVAAFFWFSEDYNVYSGSRGGLQSYLHYFSWERFGTIGLGISATVVLIVLVQWLQLSRGGSTVAEAMGGRRVLQQTDDPDERRCLNVVAELSLAATMPVPPLYVMDRERGINAFAAGQTPADAVVAVTRGTLTQLQRHELEGVIAHEFSHILNGDMRLNIRLAAMLKGITFIGDIGYMLMHSRSHRRSGSSNGQANALPLFGLALWVLGLAGGLAAGCIKAAIGRQKEYLADASAVQFTRNPDTIGDALKIIGGFVPGTLVHAARAKEMSHIFFGQVRHSLWETFSTHPPLEERIRRVDPSWNGEYIRRSEKRRVDATAQEAGVGRAEIVLATLAAAASMAAPNSAREHPIQAEQIPAELLHNSREPLGASALVYCLLLATDTATREQQHEVIASARVPGLTPLVQQLFMQVQALPSPQRLPLLELCLPALKAVSPQQYRLFKDTLLKLIHADQRVELHEWCLYQVTRHYLDPEFVRVKASRPRHRSLRKVAFHVRMALSVLAWEGSGDSESVFRTAADELDFKQLQILPREQCSVEAFSNAAQALADCYPLLQPKLLKAMRLAAAADGQLNAAEREIIASIAAVMDCPVPL